ncbi:MAG: ParB N-terminal domain-containing protein [Desulfatiglandaceae bacterium]|jgi:ParB-like chromosome segregation protein Spo0J
MIQKLGHKIDLKPSRVSLDRLSPEPGPFAMSYGFELAPLINSLQNIGLVNNPIVTEGEGGAIHIVTGFRRIAAFRAMGKESIGCRMCIQDAIAPPDALLINFFDNLTTRQFNPVEKAMALTRLARYFPREEILARYMSLLDLPLHASVLDTYLSFERDLDESMKQALARGTISESTATALLELVPEERKVVASLFLKLTFNINQQKQLIELLYDNSRISGTSIAEMLEAKPFRDILATPSMNRPQMARTLLALFRSRRFPRLNRAEEVFKKRVAKLQLPPEARIQAPPYFESEIYRMEISFRNGKDLKGVIDHLAKIERLRQFKNPWEEGA